MRLRTDVRAAAGILLLLAACTAPSTPTPSPSPEPSSALPEPGQPFDGATILAAMADSPRPDGVPDELQTDAIAAAVAEAIWTFDGDGWDRPIVSGVCGTTCTLEVSGSRAGAEGDDVWIFSVDPSSGSVEVASAELRALPRDVVGQVDRLARRLGTSLTDDMLLTTVAWQPPPDGDRFRLSYRSGGEEGSCSVEMIVDARAGTLEDERASGC